MTDDMAFFVVATTVGFILLGIILLVKPQRSRDPKDLGLWRKEGHKK